MRSKLSPHAWNSPAPSPYCPGQLRRRVGHASAAAPNPAFPQFAECNRHQIRCRLHDARELISQTARQIALNFDRATIRKVELEVRHCGKIPRYGLVSTIAPPKPAGTHR